MDLKTAVIDFFHKSPFPVLFAGAGVSARAGLPTWDAYLTELAETIRANDALSANMMREQLHDGALLKAATYYFVTNKVIDGDKYDYLSELLTKYNHLAVKSLVTLPFKSYVTTNFDRVLHDAYAEHYHLSPVSMDLGDPQLAGAAFRDSFFIARIHGKTEDSRTMILSESHYEALAGKEGYLPLLRSIFSFKQVLFVGFSFLDPAIRKTLEIVNSEYGPSHKGRHLALLPDNIEDEFIQRLNRLNIAYVKYDPKDQHAALWQCFDELARTGHASPTPPTGPVPSPEPMALAQRYIAACYARTQLGDELVPLRQAIIEGFVCKVLQTVNKTGITKRGLVDSLKIELQVRERDAARIVDESISRLTKERACIRKRQAGENDRYIWIGTQDSQTIFDDAIEILVAGTVNRYVVRESGHDTSDVRNALRTFFQELVLRRGWDLGAAFATRQPPEAVEVDRLFWSVANLLAPQVVEKLLYAIKCLIRTPEPNEATVMTNLGRASFALELAIQAPQDTLFHQATLPQRIYLDANVLLPAITHGHPYNLLYNDAITRLVAAAKKASTNISIVAYRGFLNEVVNHRRLAYEQIIDMKESAEQMLRKEVAIYGTVNMNVFVGAYALLSNDDPALTFEVFLKKYAPYETEDRLEQWLGRKGISVISEGTLTTADTIFGSVYHHSRVPSSRAFSSGLGLALVIIDPLLGKPV